MQHGQLYIPKLTKTNKAILILSIGIFLLSSVLHLMFNISLLPFLGLSFGGFFNGHIYQLITYPFNFFGVFDVIFSCLLLWFIGSELEEMWGQKRYLTFYFLTTIGAGFSHLFISWVFAQGPNLFVPFTGLTGFNNFLLLSYAILYPNRMFSFMFFFPVKAWVVCLLAIVLQLYQGIFSPAGLFSLGHLGAMAIGYGYMVFISSPRLKAYFSSREQTQNDKKRSHLTLIKTDKSSKNDDDDPPKYWQ